MAKRLILTIEVLAHAWDYLCTTAPIRSWNLPPSEEVKFVIIRSKTTAGYHKMIGDQHIVGISSNCIGRTLSLMEIMAHEQIHAHQRTTKPSLETKGVPHNENFLQLAKVVCEYHGFDPMLF
jgi:hypothetical protein